MMVKDCKNCVNFMESGGKYYCDTNLQPGIVEIEPSECGNCDLHDAKDEQ